MPGSLLGLGTKVKRNDSTRSDRSDISAHSNDSRTSVKKVSFNKAVRVKKYPLRSDEYDDSDLDVDQSIPGRRFWFKVYKNKPQRDNDWQELWSQEEECETSWGEGYEEEDPKERHQERAKLTTIEEDGDASNEESNKLHSSQLPPAPPTINRNHVRNIVSRFNEELVKLRKKRQQAVQAESKEEELETQRVSTPLEPPADYEDVSERPTSPVAPQKTRPVVNGMKSVMTSLNAGMSSLRKKNAKTRDKNLENLKKSGKDTLTRKAKPVANGHVIIEQQTPTVKRAVFNGPLTEKRTSDSRQQTSRKNAETIGGKKPLDKLGTLARLRNENKTQQPRPLQLEGKRDIAVQARAEMSTIRPSEGQTTKPQPEKYCSRQAIHESRTSITGKRSRSHDDILSTPRSTVKRVDKAVSTEDLHKRVPFNTRVSVKPSVKAITLQKTTQDKAVQCSGAVVPVKPSSTMTLGRDGRILRSKTSYAPILTEKPLFTSNVALSKSEGINTKKQTTDDVAVRVNKINPIYGDLIEDPYLTDKGDTSKRKDSAYAVSTLAKYILNSKYHPEYFATTRNLESIQKSYKPVMSFENGNGGDEIRIENDQQIASKESTNSKYHKYTAIIDLLPSIKEPVERSTNESTAGSVIREMDIKKREISYENVPREDNTPRDTSNGLWFHQNGEDYRREMAQSDIFPSKSRADVDLSFLTFNRAANTRKGRSPLPKMYSGEYNFLHESKESLVEGAGAKEPDSNDNDLLTTCHSNGYTSFCDESLYGTSELSANYTSPRQQTSREYRRMHRDSSLERRDDNDATSAVSGMSSGDSDITRRRRPLIMFIPGVSHHECPAEEDDRMSNMSTARSQTSHQGKTSKGQVPSGKEHKKVEDTVVNHSKEQEDLITPLPSVSKRKHNTARGSTDQNDIRRRHSMPKDTKLNWLKWKGKGKPSRVP